MNVVLVFVGLSIVNVIFSTVRTLATVKGGKGIASLLSGGYFAFYNIVLVYSVADFPMWEKCLITFTCNVIGVWVVKAWEEKHTKEKSYRVEVTTRNWESLQAIFSRHIIPYSILSLDNKQSKKVMLFYCANKTQLNFVKTILKDFQVKMFITSDC